MADLTQTRDPNSAAPSATATPGQSLRDASIKKVPLASTQTLSGHPDLTPAMALLKRDIIETSEKIITSRGFSPRETPLVERAEVFLRRDGSGAHDDVSKQMMHTAGHFDRVFVPEHTASLARWVVANLSNIEFPCLTYMTAKAFRGETAQKGRRREFTQFNIDIVHTTQLSVPTSEFEVISATYDILNKLGVKDFVIKIGDRALIESALKLYDLDPKQEAFLRAIDKLEKHSPTEIIAEITKTTELEADKVRSLDRLLRDFQSNPDAIMERLQGADNSAEMKYLKLLMDALRSYGIPENAVKLDLGTVRGLSYYNGVVFEVTKEGYPGSIAGGGRFDSLFQQFSKRQFFGFGAAIGVDRIIDYFGDTFPKVTKERAGVFIDQSDSNRFGDIAQLIATLRRDGVAVKSDGFSSLKTTLKAADKQNCRCAVFRDKDTDGFVIRDLSERKDLGVYPIDQIAGQLKAILNPPKA